MKNTKKKCSKCGHIKCTDGYFYRDKTKKDGLGSQCKQCTKERFKQVFNMQKTPPPFSVCTMCNESQPSEMFPLDSYTKNGISRRCKKCTNLVNRSKPLKTKRDKWLKMKYKITQYDYESILKSQNDCCAICDRHKDLFEKSLCVDHCHKTGKIRGVLCINCNAVLGKFHDNSRQFLKAYEYLKSHE